MTYWRIRFDDGERAGTLGYLVFDETMVALRLTDDDGATVTEGVTYTTVETGVAAPAWAAIP